MKKFETKFGLSLSWLRLSEFLLKRCEPVLEVHSAMISFTAFFLGASFTLVMPNTVHIYGAWSVTLLCVVAFVCRRGQLWLYSAFFVCAFAYANQAFDEHLNTVIPTDLEGISLSVEGHVLGLPSEDKARIRFDFEISEFTQDSIKHRFPWLVGKKLKLSCYRCRLPIGAGQTWQFTVRLKRPRGFASWGAFDYEKFLFRHQIVGTGYVRAKEEHHLLSEPTTNLHRSRAKLRDAIAASSGDVGSAMLVSLSLGDRSGLSNEQRAVFQRTGVSHLFAISGLHVGLVFVLTTTLVKLLLWPVARVFSSVPRQYLTLPPALLAALTYAGLAGFSVSTQRAIVMLSVYVICKLSARQASLLQVLLIAITVLLLYDPFSILDSGFWLSCYAVLIIAIVSDSDKSLPLWRLQPWLWLGMLPITALLFGQVSLISPVVNLAVVPIFCLLLIPALLVGLLFQLVGVSMFADLINQFLLTAFARVYDLLDFISAQNMAFVYTEALPPWQAILIGILVLLATRKLLVMVPAIALMALCAWPSPTTLQADEYQLTLLDVGQGLSMVLRTADYVLVYDTGPTFNTGFSTANAVLLPFLRGQGISMIDELVISHADSDHIGGLDIVLSEMPVAQLSTSRLDRIPDSHLHRSRSCQVGQVWRVGHIDFEFLGPSVDTPQGSNNRSCVLKVSNSETTALITGDIERPVERHLVATASADLSAQIMLVPHQGSKTSSSADFLDMVNPTVALLAAGYRNHYGHPHEKVVERYLERDIDLISTIENGSIQLNVRGKEIETTRFRKAQKRFWRG